MRISEHSNSNNATYCVAALAAAGLSLLSVTFPEMLIALGEGVGIRWVLLAHSAVYASAILLGGLAADIFGGRIVSAVGLALACLGAAATILSDQVPYLVATRIIQSVGLGLVLPASLAVIVESSTGASDRTQSVAQWAAVQAAAAVVGLVATALVVEFFEWRSPYLLFSLLGIACTLWLLWTPHTTGQAQFKPPSVQATRLLLFCASISWLVTALAVLANDASFLTGATNLLLASTLFVGLIVVDSKTRNPIVPKISSAHRTFRGGALGISMIGIAFFGNFFLSTLLLRSHWGLSISWAAVLSAPSGIAMGLFARPIAAFAHRTGDWRVMCLGASTGGICLLGFAWLTTQPDANPLLWSLTSFFYGLTVAASMPLFNAVGMKHVPIEEAGSAAGTLQVCRQIGGGLGAIAVASTAAVSGSSGYWSAYVTFATITMCSLLVLVYIWSPRPGTSING